MVLVFLGQSTNMDFNHKRNKNMKTKKLLTEKDSLNTSKPLIPTITDERLIPFLDRNGYSRDCAEVFTQYWHVACMAPIVGAIYMFIAREKMWSMWTLSDVYQLRPFER